MKNNLKWTKDAVIIVLVSVILAFVYNHFSPKSLDIIPVPPEVVSDDDLVIKRNSQDESKEVKKVENIEKTVTYEQLKARLSDPDVQIIDARSPDDYEKSHIGNAINIFPYEDEDVYMEKIFTEIPEGKLYIIYCNGGTCDLSHTLAKDMAGAGGFENIFIFVGGWEEWEEKENLK
jgi:rhodanese-related sulfurtransferase